MNYEGEAKIKGGCVLNRMIHGAVRVAQFTFAGTTISQCLKRRVTDKAIFFSIRLGRRVSDLELLAEVALSR